MSELKPELDTSTDLKKTLNARNVSIIAMGGGIGVGLMVGTAKALYNAGPGSVLISFLAVGMIAFGVIAAIGEMATFIPCDFAGYAHRYCHPALGFATGWTYMLLYLFSMPNQIVSTSLVMEFWVSTDQVNSGVWIFVFMVVVWVANLLPVKYFGNFECVLSSVKIVTIVGLWIVMMVIMSGGAPNRQSSGFRYWHDPGAFNDYHQATVILGPKGKALSFMSVMVNAVFSYVGIEFVCVAIVEAENPRRALPKAIKLTFWRIILIYCFTVFLLGCCVPSNDPLMEQAIKSTTSAASSPFVVAMKIGKVNGLPHLINGCILLFAVSSATSDFYVAVRTLHGLAVKRQAPRIFAQTTKHGVPIYGVLVGCGFSLLAFMTLTSSARTVFNYFVNVVSVFGLLVWISLLVAHISFMKAIKKQNLDRNSFLPWRAPFQPWYSYVCIFFCIVIVLMNNFGVFLGNKFDYKNFITGYIGIPIYLALLGGYKLINKSKKVKPSECDLLTGKATIDEDEERLKNKELEERKGREGTLMLWLEDHLINHFV
ncbi:BA75_00182T0 [Komagataella pastoris]|uniref:BA75_00182T0 n=1 Tax=Komagataella pastoris TaxID=4922 RepID=A0A1B2J6B9_PICPA|nr:BA75_00182T0 [Komagataella pastoris]